MSDSLIKGVYPHPECMAPDGADPCAGYKAAMDRIAELQQALVQARATLIRYADDDCDAAGYAYGVYSDPWEEIKPTADKINALTGKVGFDE